MAHCFTLFKTYSYAIIIWQALSYDPEKVEGIIFKSKLAIVAVRYQISLTVKTLRKLRLLIEFFEVIKWLIIPGLLGGSKFIFSPEIFSDSVSSNLNS